MAGLAAVVGHVYPIWLKFRGGKGVATACGVFAVLTPTAMAPALVVFALTVWLTKYISLGSVLATIALPAIAYLSGSPAPAIGSAVAAATLIIFRHRSNLLRLRTGSERRLGGSEFSRGAEEAFGDFQGAVVQAAAHRAAAAGAADVKISAEARE